MTLHTYSFIIQIISFKGEILLLTNNHPDLCLNWTDLASCAFLLIVHYWTQNL